MVTLTESSCCMSPMLEKTFWPLWPDTPEVMSLRMHVDGEDVFGM